MATRTHLKSEKIVNEGRGVNVVDLLQKVKFQQQKEKRNILYTISAAAAGLILIGIIASI
tara:strand:+ start:402 stop:581 length:180 start_codon:yes stop_codon:yes gene_type:complete